MAKRSAVVLGVGPTRGLGAAIARRFAREGFRVTDDGALGGEDRGGARRAAERRAPTPRRCRRRHRRGARSARSSPSAERADAPLEAAIFNAGGNWPRAFPRHGRRVPGEHVARERARRVLLREGRARRHAAARARRHASSPAPRDRSAARRCSAASRRRRRRSGRSRSRRRASSVRRASTSRTSSSTARIDGDRINTLPAGPQGRARPRRPARSRRDRRELLVALPAAAERLDPRARRPAVGGDLVTGGGRNLLGARDEARFARVDLHQLAALEIRRHLDDEPGLERRGLGLRLRRGALHGRRRVGDLRARPCSAARPR